MRSLPAALDDAASRNSGSFVLHGEDGPVRVPAAALVAAARRRAALLVGRGLQVGETVGLLGRNRSEWAEWALGVWYAGGTLVPLQFPLRIRAPDVFRHQVSSLASAAACRFVVAEPRFVEFVRESITLSWDEAVVEPVDVPTVAPEQAAVIQFTSGTTGSPKAALISHRAILANIDALNATYEPVSGRDAILSWVPLFHDLGLFKHLVWPLVAGFDCHHLPTELFAADPARWLRLFAETSCTMTTGPSSAWAAAVRAARRDPSGVDLSCVRSAIMSAEAIDADVVNDVREFGATVGLDPGAVGGAYGLAEFTLGLAAARPGSGLAIERLDLAELAAGHAVVTSSDPSKRVASCGAAYPGVTIRIASSDGRDLPDRRVGEIVVSGPSMMTGYLGAPTDDVIVDGWLHTGDLGYLSDGELYVTGRIKDVVIVFGQNYYPEDFEWAASRVAGVRPGRCAAFSPAESADRLVLVVEPSGDVPPDELAGVVRNAVRNAVAIVPVGVVVAEPGTVLKTTSGKLRRGVLRSAYAADEITALATSGM